MHACLGHAKFVKRQLKFDKPRYLFTKTHTPKTKTQMFYEKNNALFIYLMKKNIIIICNNGPHYLLLLLLVRLKTYGVI